MIYGRQTAYGEDVLAKPLNGLKCILSASPLGTKEGETSISEIYIGLTGK